MTASIYNITADQGATLRLSLRWRGPDGEPYDLTGYAARFVVRANARDQEPLIALEDDDGITLGGVDGTILVVIDDETTATLPAEVLRYDLELESADGNVARLLTGALRVRAEVAR